MSSDDDVREDIFLPDGRLRLDLLTEAALTAIYESLHQAHETRWDSVRSPHVFMGILAAPDEGVRNWGRSLEEDLSNMLEKFQELFRQESVDADAVLILNREFLSDNVIRLLRDAHQRAESYGRDQVTPMDLLITMLTSQNSIVAECFENSGVTAAKLTELAVIAEHQARAR
jgi:ATP-dependent Clp protease ATP-binding subunit ClpA